jgi:HD-GYP domain-containing protein (c-di-GMP phosphodiesterase class II)
MAALCVHDGGHSAVGRLLPGAGRLQFVLVCDACGAERGDVDSLAYRPHARPYANHPALRIAQALGIEPRRAGRVRLAALLCDIGSARIPDGVLAKPGPLTPEDWNAVQRHPEHSAAMLGGDGYDDLRPWILAHHERPDGRGYPAALPASDIPLEAAVISVATAWEAMTDERPHRPALTPSLASSELLRGAGTQFDPAVVDAALSALAPGVVARAAA